MSALTWRDQEAVDDFIQYRGQSIDWTSETGFHTLMQELEAMKLGIRIEDHDKLWRVFLHDTGGALIGVGASYDPKPFVALVKAVVNAGIDNPVGFGPAFRHDGYSGA